MQNFRNVASLLGLPRTAFWVVNKTEAESIVLQFLRRYDSARHFRSPLGTPATDDGRAAGETCPSAPQISHDLSRIRTRAASVGSLRPTALSASSRNRREPGKLCWTLDLLSGAAAYPTPARDSGLRTRRARRHGHLAPGHPAEERRLRLRKRASPEYNYFALISLTNRISVKKRLVIINLVRRFRQQGLNWLPWLPDKLQN
jgi:hypothetical protein